MMNLPPNIDKGSSSSMDQEFLPPEIIINILSRLPVKTVIHCKCVCKSWLELLKTPEFAKNHLSKSIPGLILSNDVFKIFEFINELEIEHHNPYYNFVTEFEKTTFTSTPPDDAMGIEGSANGLLLLCGKKHHPISLYVCNPITREYIELPCFDYQDSDSVTIGFGVSMTSGQYKVIRIFQECVFDPQSFKLVRIRRSGCSVYTLGTRAWRDLAPCPFYDYNVGNSNHAFLNGNLHWYVENINVDGPESISCFDLETEIFSAFPPPPPLGRPSSRSDPVVFEDCLCICDNNSTKSDNEIVIWVMKDYENKNSWTKQFVFTKHPDLHDQYFAFVYPLKVFRDGNILLLWWPYFLLCYSKKTNTAQKLDLFELNEYSFFAARLHVSSFLSLRSFAKETVSMF